MSLFNKVYTDESPRLKATVDYTAPIVEATQFDGNAFVSYVKDVMLYGEPRDSQQVEEETWTYPVDDIDSLDDDSTEDESFDEIDEDVYTEEDEEEDDEVDPSYALTERQQLLQPTSTPQLAQASSIDQKGDTQVQRIVDGLFDRMHAVWPKTGEPTPQVEQSEPRKQAAPRESAAPTTTALALTESKAEIAKIIRREIPQAMKGELVKVMRTEIVKVMRTEIVRVVREEFESLNRTLMKNLERLHAIEARMAKIEGAVGQDLKLNFPEGMVQIDAPVTVTVPEREVKVAAPINVQPPSVVFDEGAISVQFNKTGGKKEVRFDRDPHNNCIKAAEIIDVPGQ